VSAGAIRDDDEGLVPRKMIDHLARRFDVATRTLTRACAALTTP
jgi:hypothetical protein